MFILKRVSKSFSPADVAVAVVLAVCALGSVFGLLGLVDGLRKGLAGLVDPSVHLRAPRGGRHAGEEGGGAGEEIAFILAHKVTRCRSHCRTGSKRWGEMP